MVRTRSGGLPENAHIVEEREKAAAEKRRISADKRKVAADKRADEKRRRVEVIIPKLRELFYDLDLTDFPKVSPGGSADELATYVVEHPRKFRKKPKEIPRVPTQDELETAVVDLVNAAETVYIPPDGKLLTAFMKDFHEFFSTESRLNNGKQFNADITSQLLHHNFPFCRTALILHLMDEFDGLYSAPAAVCFSVESCLPELVRKYYLHIEDFTWDQMVSLMPSSRKRRRNPTEIPNEDPIIQSVHKWETFLDRSQHDFPQLFENGRLVRNAGEINFPTFDCAFLNQATTHHFCYECIRGQANAATVEMPLAEGGIGLQCMENNCKNPILFSDCRDIIAANVKQILNDRIIEESLGRAKLNNLERCKKCNFGIEIEVPKDIMKVFSCLKCRYEYCRVCERDWDDQHFGKSCEEMEQLEENDRQVRKVEDKMSQAVIRQCDKCGLPFVRLDGCNKIVCRCGQTQCYLCRATGIQYNHFCQHFRTPGQKSCKSCKNKCLLWEDPNKNDNQMLNQIRQDAEKTGLQLN
ncbi:E3 ubiquitin-protein ligase [Ditylenchus destructor]|nr:E3 ubiquitin-protein ligase [Ditylenchus destructor]